MSTPEQLTEKQANLAKKSIWITVILSFIFPPGGYIYTHRSIGFPVSFLYIGGLLAGSESDLGISLLSLAMVFSPLENSIQVIRAKWKNRKHQTSSSSPKKSPQIESPSAKTTRAKSQQREELQSRTTRVVTKITRHNSA